MRTFAPPHGPPIPLPHLRTFKYIASSPHITMTPGLPLDMKRLICFYMGRLPAVTHTSTVLSEGQCLQEGMKGLRAEIKRAQGSNQVLTLEELTTRTECSKKWCTALPSLQSRTLHRSLGKRSGCQTAQAWAPRSRLPRCSPALSRTTAPPAGRSPGRARCTSRWAGRQT